MHRLCQRTRRQPNSDGCRVCSDLAKPQHRAKCISCFDMARKVVGPADLADAVQSCRTCATSAADFTACENCILTKPYSSGCGCCALLKAPSDQTSCYKYSADGKLSGGFWIGSDCLGRLSAPQERQRCLNCLHDPKSSSARKSFCWACHNWYNTPEGRNKCVKCLGTPQKDYLACSRL